MAEGGGLLNRYRVVKPYRGFESLRLRQLRFRHRSLSIKLANNIGAYLHISYLSSFAHLCYNSWVERG